MAELDPVTQEVTADLSGYVGPILGEGVPATEALAAAVRELDDALAGLSGRTVAVGVTGLAGTAAEAQALRGDVADISADLMTQTALLRDIGTAMTAIQRDAADTSADLMIQTGLLGEIRDQLAESAAAAAAYRDAMTGAAASTAAAGTALTGVAAAAGIGAAGIFTILHLSAALLGSQIAADTIGITAFGLATARTIGPAVSAASSVANLTTAYAGLDPQQQAAALSIKAFTDSLHTADETGVLGVFYQGLSLAQGELGKGSGIVTQATQAFSDFFGMIKADLGSGAWSELLKGSTGIIRTDLDALFKLVDAGIQVIPGLFHNLNFLGTGFFATATGALHAVAAVTEFNPALTKAAAIAGVAYGAYHILWTGLGAGPGPIQAAATALAGFGSRAGVAATYMSEGAGVAASYGLGIGAISGTAIAATAGIAALAIGIGALIYVASHATDATAAQIGALRAEYQATGNNVAGYQAMDDALQRNISALGSAGQVTQSTGSQYERFGPMLSSARISTDELTAALQGNRQILANISGNASAFGADLALSSRQVIAFANATGVDLTHALAVGSSQFTIDAGKIQGYATAVALSHSPLAQFKVDAQQASDSANSLADQVKALTAAYTALVTPTLNVISGAVTLKQDQAALTTALQASNDHVGLASVAAQNAAQAMVKYANDTIAQSDAIKTQTGSTQAAVAPLNAFASMLEATGAKGAYVSQVLHLIKEAEDALYDKTVHINIVTATSGGSTGGPVGHPTNPGAPGGGGGFPAPTSGLTFVTAQRPAVTVPVTVNIHAAAGSLADPRFLQGLQPVIEEAILRHAYLNQSAGLRFGGFTRTL